jgi:ketosteroid isomerase-like protein
MSDQENVAVVRQAYENFKGGNIGGILDSLTDDVDWRLPPMENIPFSGRHSGREGVAGFFSELAGSQDSVSFEPREFVAQGDKVVALGTYRWRVKKNGREYGGDWAHVFTVRDGKIVGFHEYMDSAAATAAHA